MVVEFTAKTQEAPRDGGLGQAHSFRYLGNGPTLKIPKLNDAAVERVQRHKGRLDG